MFVIKKIVSAFLLPLPVCLGLIFLGLVLLWFTRRQWTGKIIASLGFVCIVLLSYGFLPDHLLISLEREYKPYDVQLTNEILKSENRFPLKYVVVLGGGNISDPAVPITSRLGESTITRLIEGIVIYRQSPGSKLILSGAAVFDSTAEAVVMKRLAYNLGVDEKDLIMETQSKDTADQVTFIKALVKTDPFALVTSASHMPRAMALFEKGGLQPIPAPTHHYVKKGTATDPAFFFPRADNLTKAEVAVHEYLGQTWAVLRGQI